MLKFPICIILVIFPRCHLILCSQMISNCSYFRVLEPGNKLEESSLVINILGVFFSCKNIFLRMCYLFVVCSMLQTFPKTDEISAMIKTPSCL